MQDGAPRIVPRLRRVATDDLTDDEVAAARAVLWAAFTDVDGGMTEDDWAHSLGGVHILLELGGDLIGHASVVERELQVDGRPVRTGYVEGVAIDPRHQGNGFGSRVMTDVASHIEAQFALGALSTGTPRFYERLGWLPWSGPTFVRMLSGPLRTPEDDDGILILWTPTSPPGLDRSGSLSCDWRAGDVW